MALIGKIRKNFWFVLIILGLALAAFVIMDMTSASQRGTMYNPSLGSVNGEKIDARVFSNTENILSQNAQGQDPNARRANLWEYFVSKTLVADEADDLGITVPVEELKELQFGQNLSPIIQQSFFDPNLGDVNRQQLAQIQNAILNNQELGNDFRAYWSVQEQQIIADQLQNKLTNLVTKSLYTPTWMTEAENKIRNTRAQVAYVKVPFDAVADDEVEVTDADIKSYINNHKEMYTNNVETRVLEYITFPIVATAEDTMKIYEDILSRTAELGTTANDSIYAINNNGAKPTIYYAKDELPEALQSSIDTIEIGETFGPYLDNGVYSAVKLVAKQVIPDSVQARVIFRQAPSTNPALVESSRIYLDSLKNLLATGAQEFDSLAMTNSQDGSAAQGGDLGYMTQGMLNPTLDRILFLDGNRTGQIYEAESENGLFLIELTDIIQRNNDPKYRLAYINASIVPSSETQNNVLDKVNDFISENRTMDDMRSAAAEQNLNIRTSAPLDRNAYSIGALGAEQSSRNIIRWAFDPSTEKGDVSPDFFSYQDPVLYYTDKYVIAGLGDVVPAGIQKAENLRNELTPIVRNMKKGEKIKQEISGKDLNAVASQYSVSVDTLAAVTMNTTLIPSLGNEPKFVSAVFAAKQNEIGGPVIGNSGVFVVKPIAIAGPGTTANVASVRSSATTQARTRVGQNLIGSLKKKAKIKDERYEYGF